MQTVVEGQATPESDVSVAPAGVGTGWIAQPFPFQRSASGTLSLELLK